MSLCLLITCELMMNLFCKHEFLFQFLYVIGLNFLFTDSKHCYKIAVDTIFKKSISLSFYYVAESS